MNQLQADICGWHDMLIQDQQVIGAAVLERQLSTAIKAPQQRAAEEQEEERARRHATNLENEREGRKKMRAVAAGGDEGVLVSLLLLPWLAVAADGRFVF